MASSKVEISLTRSEALVLYDLTQRFSETELLTVDHPSEKQVLWNLSSLLEKILVEPLEPEYETKLNNARVNVMGRTDDR